MALAPRKTPPKTPPKQVEQPPNQPDKPVIRDSGLGKEGKRAQRSRNKDSPTAKLTTSGSSGQAKQIAQFPKIPFTDVEDDVQHLCDIAGRISHSQVGNTGWLTSTLNVPLEYAHDVLEAHMASKAGMVFMRLYYVSIDDYLSGTGFGDDNGDEQ